jgi:hypothetical protein
MSIHLASGSDWYDIGSIFDYNAPYTASFWFSIDSVPSFSIILNAGLFNISGAGFDYMATNGSTPEKMEMDCSSGGGPSGTTTISGATWYFIAMRRNSTTSLDMFVSTGVEANIASDVTARLAGSGITIGQYRGDGTNPIVGKLTQLRLWTAALSNAELATEKAYTFATASVKAAHPGALWAEYRFVNSGSATTDSSGNARTLTSHGSPTTGADDPPGQTAGDGSGGAAGYMWL